MSSAKTGGFLVDPNDVEKYVLKPDITFEESQNLYKQWAKSGTYDTVHEDCKIYRGSDIFEEGIRPLFRDVTSVSVLDAGAGTGLTGQRLHQLGYKTVDALEPIESFADRCKGRGYYRSVFNQPVSAEHPIPMPDNSYDAVCVVGAFGPGAMPPSAVPEFFRVIKPGGFFVNNIREEYFWTVPMYKDTLKPLFDRLESEKKIAKVEWFVYEGHWQDKKGVRMVYKKL